ncbi:autotransporter outer membrane beta-barrel domain-containing protein [Klebsiella sp. BIGb0407]|uniref:autotransporter outer membrane beta-barrel domain-containing protein n=1 Tax=Klebsiella sp. BIGb0407 TaxID=2940603 RepID=UPI002168E600|nr:autotransporter outer membrane beta-barrel domain-containing protein [Klebsiella sp. BIGb0407]MCS3429602.1 autotransporter family porin [Klebsiella sp. BIGb0407]
MSTRVRLKRNIAYISLLSCFTLSIMEAQANDIFPAPEFDATITPPSVDDFTVITDSTLRIERSVGTDLNPEKLRLKHGELDIQPGSRFIGSIIGDNSEINVNRATITGDIYLHQQSPEDESIPNKLSLKDTLISSNNRHSAIDVESGEVSIETCLIRNSTGGGINITKKSILDDHEFLDATINKTTIITGDDYGIVNQLSNVSINDTIIKTGQKNRENTHSTGVKIYAKNAEHESVTTTEINNSKINSYGDGIFMSGGDTDINNSIIMAGKNYAIMTEGGNLALNQSSVLKANNNAHGIYIFAGKSALYNNNTIIIDNSAITTTNNTAIVVNREDIDEPIINNTEIMLTNNSQISAGNDIALESFKYSNVNIGIHESTISGGISAHHESIINILLGEHSLFDGYTRNVNNFTSGWNSLWKLTTNSDTENLNHAGNIVLTDMKNKGIALLIHNNYFGMNGTMTFNSKLTDQYPLPDKLIIGGNSFGTTNVAINNIGGAGDARLNGFELIHVDGSSGAVFSQSGRIIAGAYDYSLVRGQGNNSGNWYLTSQASLNSPQARHIVRPEAASYIANLSAANTLFATAINDRPADTEYTDVFTGKKKWSSLWLRQTGSHNNWRDNSSQLTTQTNNMMTQLGGDILRWSTNNRNRGNFGLTAGHGTSRSNSHSAVTDYHSKSSAKGYSIGTYASWYGNHTDKSGLYINSWLQYNWFNNHVQGQNISAERYQSKGVNTSLEAGYTFKMGELTDSKEAVNSWFIQPQAQVTLMNVKSSNHREANGTRVISNGEGNIQTRLGIRASMKGHHILDKNKEREFEPFIEANWLHNTRSFSVKMDDARVTQAGTRDIGEVKIGVAGKLNPKINLWANTGSQVGHKGYSNTSAMLGIKYNF